MKFLLGALFTVFVAIVGVFAIVTSGVVNVGADQEHSPMMFSFLETARNRSIANASKDIVVPDLEKVDISSGGADYKDMCAAVTYLREWTKLTLAKTYIQSHLTSLRLRSSNVIKQRTVQSKAFGQSNTELCLWECLHGAPLMMTLECGQWLLLSDRYLN